MESFLFSTLSGWIVINGPLALKWLFVAISLAAYAQFRPGKQFERFMRKLLVAMVALDLLLAAYITVVQYYSFLAPFKVLSFFVTYALVHFYLPLGLAFVCAAVWYIFLRVLHSRTERYFDVGEIELTTLLVLVVGWPLALVLVPFAGIVLVILSLVRLIVFKQELTTLGLPFIIAATLLLLFEGQIRPLFGL